MNQEHAYVSILSWRKQITGAEQADLFTSLLGLDRYQAASAVRRGFPQVVQRVPAEAGPGLLERLETHDIDAFALSESEVRLAASSLRVRRLSPALGAPQAMYECEPALGRPFGIKASDVALLVRAAIPHTESGVSGHSAAWNMQAAVSAPQTAALGAAGLNNMSAARTVRKCVAEVLDIFLRDGSHLRVEADRFSFDLPGAVRHQNDRQQLDALAQRLSSDAPGALLDLGFGQFRCPASIIRAHHAGAGESGSRRPAALAAFDFYSAWVWLCHKRPLSINEAASAATQTQPA